MSHYLSHRDLACPLPLIGPTTLCCTYDVTDAVSLHEYGICHSFLLDRDRLTFVDPSDILSPRMGLVATAPEVEIQLDGRSI